MSPAMKESTMTDLETAEFLALIDGLVVDVSDAHELALDFDAQRALVPEYVRAEMRAVLTSQGVKMMQADAVFAAYV